MPSFKIPLFPISSPVQHSDTYNSQMASHMLYIDARPLSVASYLSFSYVYQLTHTHDCPPSIRIHNKHQYQPRFHFNTFYKGW